MALTFRALSAACAVLVLAGCATTPPPAVTVSPTASSTVSSSPPASATSASATPSTSGSTSASPSATPTTTPASKAIVLQGKGIDSSAFGTAESAVTAVLTAKSGKPDDSFSGKVCELDGATPYGRQLVYGGAVFLFQSKAKGTKNSPRTFTSWVVNLDQPLNSSMRLAPGYPSKTSFAKLKAAFPAGKLTKLALGESAVWVFRTPSGIWYRGDDSKTPTDVGAGAMGTCE